MKLKQLHLDYKDENEKIREELDNILEDMEKIDGFSQEEFYSKLDKIITELSRSNSFEIIRMYPRQKPIYLFGVLYYNLKDMDSENSLDKEFDYLKEFIDCKIDLFMIVNFMR